MSICETCGHNSSWDDDSPSRALEEIDTELSRFQAFSARYIATLALLDAVTYPVLSLPTEITSRIFVECLPTHGYVHIALETSELWRSLEMDCLKSSNGKPVLPADHDDASWAEHISFAIQPRLMSLDMLRNAPLLTKLHWTRFSISMQPPDFRHFASTTLTTLDITSNVGHRTPLLFLNLLSLRLRNSSLAQVSPIHALKLLTLPHIQRLGCSSYLDPNVVLPFLSRSACAIRELEWDIDETNDIWRHREIMQAVETLRVTVHCKISRFLPLIDPESNAYRQLLPQLRHITVDYDCYDTYGFLLDHTRISAILDVASRRRRANTGTAQLESFHLVLRDSTEWDSWSAIFAAQLRHLISSGLDFTVALGDGTAIWPEGSQI
ncbi:hypothetical protein B0H13DRAFT_2127162 [Mycena leptocephala]|nr:hypothetical protein B0H13DRAFT_2127162 [Mycena leptocephala]